MFKNKKQECLFTAMTSGLMIYIMGVYNSAIHSGGLEYASFGRALKTFPVKWAIGFVLAFFLASRIAKRCAFKVAHPTDRPIFIVLCIQTFTVCSMVPMMSLISAIINIGLSENLPTIWLQAVVLNFVVAYPLQVFVVGPFCRWTFRKVLN